MSPAKKTAADRVTEAVRKLALTYPETTEAGVCVNTAFQARKKSFLFMGMRDADYHFRLKLRDSLPEAMTLAKRDPERYQAASIGWVKVTLPLDEAPPKGLIERWTDESYRLLAPKTLVRQLPEA